MGLFDKTTVFDPAKPLQVSRNSVTGAVSTVSSVPQDQPAQPAQPLQLPTGEQTAQTQFEESFEVPQFGLATPRTRLEGVRIEQGEIGAVTTQAWMEGMLGFGDRLELSPRERDRIAASAENFASRAPITAFAAGMAARFGSDLPLDFGVAMLSGPLGAGMELMAQTNKLRTVTSLQKLAKARRTLRRARTSGTVGQKLVANAKVDIAEGAVTGLLSESILQGMGKGGDVSDVIRAGIADAVISPFFGTAFRALGDVTKKGYGALRGKYIDRNAKDIADGLGVDEAVVKGAMEDVIPLTIDDLTPEARERLRTEETAGEGPVTLGQEDLAARQPRAQSVRAQEATRPPDVDVETPLKSPDTAARSAEVFSAKPNRKNLIKFFEQTLKPDEVSNAGKYADILEARARSAGMDLDAYVRAKGLKAEIADTISVLARDGKLILQAPRKAVDGDDFIHEIGHIVRSDIGGKHLTELESAYGVEPGAAWTRQQEEQFADDVVKFISDDAADQPRGLRRALKAFTDWIKNTYGKLFGLGDDAPQNAVLSRLFTEIDAEPFAVPTAAREAEVAAQRTAEGTEQLFATGKAPKKAKPKLKRKPLPEKVQKTQARLKKIATSMSDPDQGVKSGIVFPKTKTTSRMFKILDKGGVLLGPGALFSGVNFFPLLGKTFNTIMQDRAVKSVTDASRLQLNGIRNLRDGAKRAGISLDDARAMGVKRKHELEIVADFTFTKGKKGSAKITKRKMQAVELTDTELIDLKALAMDGTRKGKKPTLNSAQRKMVDFNSGVQIKDKKLVLTKEQLVKIQSDDFLPPKLQRLYEGMLKGYQSYAPEMNAIGQRTIGRNIADVENPFYTPQRTIEKEGNEMDVLFEELSSGKDVRQARGALAQRRGNAPLQIGDAIAKYTQYNNSMSKVLGHLEIHKELSVAFKHSRAEIRESMGPNTEETVQIMIDNLVNRNKSIGISESALINKLFSLRQLSILGLNLSTVLKQWGSAWTAAALRSVKGEKLLDTSGGSIAGEAARLFRNKDVLAKDSAEMMANSPMMELRSMARQQLLEFETDGGGDIARIQALHGQLDIKTLFKMFKTKGVSKLDTQVALAEKGMFFVTESDRIMMTAIWNTTKKNIDPQREGENLGSYLSRVNTLFTEVAQRSQPTTDPLSRSVLQTQRGLFTKTFSQFTTQTRRNGELGFEETAIYLNKPKELRTDKDVARFRDVMLSLLAGNAFAVAMGTVAGELQEGAVSLTRGEDRQKRIDARRDSIANRVFHRGIRDLLGQLPVTGKIAGDLLSAILGGTTFTSEIPLIGEIEKGIKSVSDRDVPKLVETALGAGGVPRSLVARPIGEVTRQVVD